LKLSFDTGEIKTKGEWAPKKIHTGSAPKKPWSGFNVRRITDLIKTLHMPQSPSQKAKIRILALEKGVKRLILLPAIIGLSRLKRWSPRQPARLGAFSDRASALAGVPRGQLATYDHVDVASLNFQVMCQVRVWDYPVMFWLEKLHKPGMRILDAGGHFGTKYIAFRGKLRLDEIVWTVYDLPETVFAARAAQQRGEVPNDVSFISDLVDAPPTDLLLASGLLNYLDIPFPEFLARLPNRPQHILLNKVATRDGPPVITLERIGPAHVPYQIRCLTTFEAELAEAGYRIADRWEIPSFNLVIDTHPELGRSISRGYLLQRLG